MTKTLIQITDTHLLDSPEEFLRGENPWYNLKAILDKVKKLQPDGLLLTGDLTDKGSKVAYEYLLKAMNEFNCPIYWLYGNHDDGNLLTKMLSPINCLGCQSIDLGFWRLLLLDSVLVGAKFGGGYIKQTQLDWLKEELIKYRDKPTMIALHHHPVTTGIDWVDQIGVENGDDLIHLLQLFSQVRLVLFGHIHHALHYHHVNGVGKGIDFWGCPSTFSQVSPAQPTHDSHLPGFRVINLFENGDYSTEVQRLNFSHSLEQMSK
ncbi:metallophosphoesterase [Cyanobacterium stanieri LEGE 03274]|uniref:Metallophosphoesterase n=1 Tax=Cyanobacterium stanieri LEGE 03274 TaxID=1828756 RepID=A0ABR9V0Z5_9CHRO|nr:metallophosphoesterase [Cyanobacterium stanieri]MBE9221564.1 metallophosphoesterase [Cyanobacterium stanieri LEGE 03274]